MTIYDGYTSWKANKYPAVLAIGDSWFWYPKNNLLESLARHPKLKDGYQHMVRLGENGARLSEYVDGPLSGSLNDLLKRDPMQYFNVFAVSGAGNDTVKYELALNADCSGDTTAEACISDAGLDALIGDLALDMRLLLAKVMSAFDLHLRQPIVLVHGYDYPVPDGRGFSLAGLVNQGPWLAPAMNAHNVPADPVLRKRIMHILIERLNVEFARFANPANGVHFIDSRDTLDSGPGYPADWDNELHPTRSGFDKIVDRKWIPVLEGLGIARD